MTSPSPKDRESHKGANALFEELTSREQDVRDVITGTPSFVSYYLVRSADGGASITVCQDQARHV